MVNATRDRGCPYLGRIPANVKFEVELVLDDGSYLSWIYPDGKSKKKGGTKIQVRVIEYTIDVDGQQQTYRLITSLMDMTLFPALLLASEYHQRWEIENTIDELKTHLNGRKTPIRSLKQERSCSRNLWLAFGTLCSAVFNVHCRTASWNISIAFGVYWHSKSDSTGNS